MRYIDSLNLKDNIKCFILIEPGLGYIIPVLQERFKTSKIIVLHIENLPLPEGFGLSEIPALHSTEPLEVQKFLEAHIPEIDVKSSRIIEWRPSLNFYREAYVKLLSLVVDFIKRTDAGNRTTAAFGRRWVRNFFKNLGNINKNLLYKQAAIPVIVAGSGPSLEQALPVIQKACRYSLIIAASSSVMALSAGGITADIVIAADGGCWALKHMYPFYRNTAGTTALAVNLCAALPSQCINTPQLIINDGSFWQSVILHELKLPSVLISQKGTVSATAAELAMLLSGGNIYLAGMDFAVRDIRTHSRPYSFDSLLFDHANRVMPVYSKSFSRSGLLRQGGSMDIYAAWFKSQIALWPKRLFSIGSGNNIFENGDSKLISENSIKQADFKEPGHIFKVVNICEDTAQFGKRGLSALLAAMKDPQYAENLKTELSSLLFPGKKTITGQELETAVKETVCKNGFYE